MSIGSTYVEHAESYLGTMESPKGSNTGGPINAWWKEAGYGSPVPWCGCFVLAMAKDVGWENMASVAHGYTGTIVDRARGKGWLKAGGAGVPRGALFVKGGATGHVGIVAESGPSLFRTVEGNANDGVRSLVRAWSDGWQAVVPPDTGTAAVTTMYGFEDLATKPTRYGGWATAEARNNVMAAFQKSHPDWWARPIRINTNSPFAFEAGKPGTYGEGWNYGPWASKATRDSQMAKWTASHHQNVRTYSTERSSGAITGNVTSGGKVS
jgi:hypothetical protein